MPPSDLPLRNLRTWWEAALPLLDCSAVITSLVLVRLASGKEVEEATLLLALVAAVTFSVLAQITGLHRPPKAAEADRELGQVAVTWTLAVFLLAAAALAGRWGELYARSELFAWIVAAPALVGVCRMCLRIVQQGVFRQGVGVRRVGIVGRGNLASRTAAQLSQDSASGWKVVGCYDSPGEADIDPPQSSATTAGDLNELIEAARTGRIDCVMITLPMSEQPRIRELLYRLSDSTVSVYLIPDVFVFEMMQARWTHFGRLPAVSIFESPIEGIDGTAKRLSDIVLASVALTAAAVPMLVIAAAVKLTSPGPVIFRQRRYGLDGREIRVWKFRTMKACEDGNVIRQATRDDPRITRVGAFLRKTSLDELPQLFNVLGGSMSLVGPRPHATAHNEAYRTQILGYMLRHQVKPGITGLAQVSGCRGETDTLEKMQRRIEFDHQYIRGWSLWLDIKILIRTLKVVWKQPEAY